MKKVALVIGGSSGIGFELVKKLVKNQYIVYNASRNSCMINDVINITFDTYSDKNIINEIKERKIDLVVYASGFSMASPIEAINEEDYKYLFEVNYFAIIKILKQLIPSLKKNDQSQIILFGSIASYLNIPYDTYYSASKAALNLLSLELNLELNRFGIKTRAVCLGPTKTNFSFKRKIYDESKDLIDYYDYDNAVNSLITIEQNGLSPTKVANKIYREILSLQKCKKIDNYKYFKNIGLKNKIYYILYKLMPVSVVIKFLKKKYNMKK